MKKLINICILLIGIINYSMAATVYVTPTGAGLQDGTSWGNAYPGNQLAAQITASQTGTDIWVAAGTYYPGASGNTGASFNMKNGVTLYGGFNGTETLLSQRAIGTYVTILSGDLDQSGTFTGNDAYHVIYSSGNNNTAIVDGFTITGGNMVAGFGSGGGAAYITNGNPVITRCVISNNHSNSFGGGIYCDAGGNASITKCYFSGNACDFFGGAMRLSLSSPYIANCVFTLNNAYSAGIESQSNSIPTIVNCTFYNNIDGTGFGTLRQSNGSNAIITNCILWNNGGPDIEDAASTSTVSYSDVEGGWGGNGSNNIDVDPLFVNTTALFVHPCSPTVDAGTNTGAPADDFAGNARPYNSITDMGPFEVNYSYVAPVPSVSISPSINNVCSSGGNVTITANPTNGGTAPTYEFFVNTISVQNGTGATYTSALANGDVVTCTMNSNMACASPTTAPSNSVTMNFFPQPTVGVNASPSTVICAGSPLTLSGTGALTYSWSGGITNGVAFNPTGNTVYTVTGTDANGCSNTATYSVTVETPSVAISANGSTTLCSPATVTLNASAGNHPLIFNVNSNVSMTDFNIGTSNFTIEAWIRPSSNGGYLIHNRSYECCAAGRWFVISRDFSGKLSIELAGDVAPYTVYTGNTVMPVNTWSHIAVVRNGTSLLFYVNGVLDATFSDPIVRNLTTGNNIGHLGGWPEFGSSFYNGKMDQVRVWHTVRTAGQIQAAMNTIFITAQTGLHNNYAFLEAAGTTAIDLGSSPANGTLSGVTREVIATSPVAASAVSSYLWTNSATTPSITVSSTGTYSVQVTTASGCTATSNSINVNVTVPAGNPATFGNGVWNVYAWNVGGQTNTGSSWNTNYSGYYTATGLNFDTQNQWNANGTPSSATGYAGCTVNADNHSWSAKRSGFPCSYYQIDITSHDDQGELYINNVMVWQHIGCCDSHTNVWSGFLSSTDNVEFRVTEGGGGSVGSLTITPVTPTIAGASAFCTGSSNVLTAPTISGGGYLWSTTATTNTITVNTGGTYSVTITGANGCSASASKAVTMNPLPVVSAGSNSTICDGSSITLNATGASYYDWSVSQNILPLDSVSGSTLALGLRKLKSSYSGPCLRLRRSSDNAEMDFGFSGNNLDKASIQSWLNGATGYCVYVYDQSGNFGDIYTYDPATQPTLVLNGINGRPVLHFNTTQTLYNEVYYSPGYTAVYGSKQTGGVHERVLSSAYNNWLLGYWGGFKSVAYFEGWVSTGTNTPDNAFTIYTGSGNGSTSQLYENGTLLYSNSGGLDAPYGIELNGTQGYTEFSDCDFTDVMLFGSVLSNSDRTLVENSISNYYGSNHASLTVSPSSATTYNVVGTDVNGCSASATNTVSVNIPSTDPVSATSDALNNEICSGSGTNLTVSGGSLGTGADWKWHAGSCTGTIVGTGASINVSPTTNTTYYVRAEGPAPCSPTNCVQVSISVKTPTTSIGTVTVPTYACSGNSFAANCNTVATATTYTWDGPTGTFFNGGSTNPFTATSPNVTVNYGAPNGSGYNICVQASNACGSTNRKCSWVRGTVNVPGTITAANNRATECASTSANYSIAAIGGATGYTWTITGDATVTGNGINATVNFGSAWTGGNLCVIANTPCYSSAPRCFTLSNGTSAPGAITGSSTACPGSSATYSVPVTTGAATYNWILPPNATGSSGSNSILVNFANGFTQGDIKISITSICGVTSVQKIKTVASGLPVMPASISGNIAGLCGQTTTFSCPSVSGASSYTWTTPGTINSGQGSTSVNATFGAFTNGNVCVTANNGCGAGASRCIPVIGKPAINGTITFNPGTICASMSGVDVQVNPVFGASTYSWSFPSGVSLVLDLGNEQIVNWGPTGGTVSVTAANACGNTTKLQNISLTCREIGQEKDPQGSSNSFSVFPNPAHDKINVSFFVNEQSNYLLKILDISGRVISSENGIALKGNNELKLDLNEYAKGVYLLQLNSESFSKQVRLVVE